MRLYNYDKGPDDQMFVIRYDILEEATLKAIEEKVDAVLAKKRKDGWFTRIVNEQTPVAVEEALEKLKADGYFDRLVKAAWEKVRPKRPRREKPDGQ